MNCSLKSGEWQPRAATSSGLSKGTTQLGRPLLGATPGEQARIGRPHATRPWCRACTPYVLVPPANSRLPRRSAYRDNAARMDATRGTHLGTRRGSRTHKSPVISWTTGPVWTSRNCLRARHGLGLKRPVDRLPGDAEQAGDVGDGVTAVRVQVAGVLDLGSGQARLAVTRCDRGAWRRLVPRWCPQRSVCAGTGQQASTAWIRFASVINTLAVAAGMCLPD